jgi:urea transport system permease protein
MMEPQKSAEERGRSENLKILHAFFRVLLRFVCACSVLAPAAAAAEELSPASFLDLSSQDPKRVVLAIDRLAQSREAAALSALRAMREGTLRIDSSGRPFMQSDGGLVGILDGKPGTAPGAVLSGPAVTNVLRRELARAIARLELSAPDEETRLLSARVLAESPEPELEGAMRAALRGEPSDDVRELLAVALAQLDLESPDAARRLAALEAIEESGVLRLAPRVEALLARPEPDVEVQNAARHCLGALAQKAFVVEALRDFFYGASLGSVLLLVALGLAITFGLMGVINMAHGEMLMIGAYTTYVVQTLFQRFAPGAIDWYLPAALPVAFFVSGLVGVALERGIVRRLYGRPLETLLATWGVSLILIQTVRLAFGAANVAVANPTWLTGGYELMSGVVLPYPRIATVGFAALVTVFVGWLLQRTDLGLHVRAITQNRGMAGCMGVRTARVDMLTFGLGSGIAGLAGVALSQLGNVGPELGQLYILDSFMVVVVGGVGKLAGTIATSLGLGVVNKYLEPLAGAVLGKIFVLAFVILFIQRRPQGLFALKGRAAEA